jgi:hypothetical protein
VRRASTARAPDSARAPTVPPGPTAPSWGGRVCVCRAPLERTTPTRVDPRHPCVSRVMREAMDPVPGSASVCSVTQGNFKPVVARPPATRAPLAHSLQPRAL